MNDRSENTGALSAAIAVALFLLLLVVGGGAAVFFVRQQTQLRAGQERALAAERMALMQAEEARAAAEQARQLAEEARSAESGNASAASQTPQDPPSAEIPTTAAVESVLQAQVASWNQGDIRGFLQHYWNSDELTFSSGGETTRGWENTRKRYQERYPTVEQMGQLDFDHLEVTPLGHAAALVLGRWHLKRASEPLHGNFSVVMRRFDDRWLIIHDHTSRSE